MTKGEILKERYESGRISKEMLKIYVRKGMASGVTFDSNDNPVFDGVTVTPNVASSAPSGSSDNVWAEIAAAIRNGVNDIDG